MAKSLKSPTTIEAHRKPTKKHLEALTSWKSYQETGKHLTGQEVHDWLKTWGTDKEKKIPECHE